MHEYIPVVLLMASVFVGIWLNRRDTADLRSDMSRQFDAVNKSFDPYESETNKRLDRIDIDLKQFYGQDKLFEGRVNELSSRLK